MQIFLSMIVINYLTRVSIYSWGLHAQKLPSLCLIWLKYTFVISVIFKYSGTNVIEKKREKVTNLLFY